MTCFRMALIQLMSFRVSRSAVLRLSFPLLRSGTSQDKRCPDGLLVATKEVISHLFGRTHRCAPTIP